MTARPAPDREVSRRSLGEAPAWVRDVADDIDARRPVGPMTASMLRLLADDLDAHLTAEHAAVAGDRLVLDVLDTPVRARDVAPGADVRPAFGTDYWRVLEVEPLHSQYVKIVWDLDAPPPHRGPDAWTTFTGDEWLAQR